MTVLAQRRAQVVPGAVSTGKSDPAALYVELDNHVAIGKEKPVLGHFTTRSGIEIILANQTNMRGLLRAAEGYGASEVMAAPLARMKLRISHTPKCFSCHLLDAMVCRWVP